MFGKDVVGLEFTDSPKNDLTMFEAAAFATTHESDSHVVDCAEVCLMRDIAEVDTDPNSLP